MFVPVDIPPSAIAARSFTSFVLAYAALLTAATACLVVALVYSSDVKTLGLVFLATPIVLLFTARWVGASTSLITLVLRSGAMHALAPIPSVFWFLLSQADRPGASGHGGVALGFIIAIVFVLMPAALIGILAAFLSFGTMRLLGLVPK